MKILEHTELNPVASKLRISLTPEEMVSEYEKTLKELAKDSKVPGFRKGKAPRKILERFIGLDEIWRMTREKASINAFKAIAEIENIAPIIEPQFEHTDYNGKGDYEFTAIYHPEPPSPEEMLRRAVKKEAKAPMPEDHLPDDVKDKTLSAHRDLLNRHTNPFDHDHIISGQVARHNPSLPDIENSPAGVLNLPGIPEQNSLKRKNQLAFKDSKMIRANMKKKDNRLNEEK